MSTLTIRNLPDDVHRELRIRAAKAKRSMEAEVRAILADACRPSSGPSVLELQQLVDEIYDGKKHRKSLMTFSWNAALWPNANDCARCVSPARASLCRARA
jgi:plasmid stability protein